MADRSLTDIADKLKAIDVAMFVTKTGSEAAIAARPMSNNKDVDADDGTTYHFATDDGRIDGDLKKSDQCGATYSRGEFYCAIQGTATLHRDRETQKKHWVPDLEKWFEEGLDTEGLILIEVKPKRIHWWEGREEGKLTF